MEDFQRKRQYLKHLKQISSIKNGHYKSSVSILNSKILNNTSLTIRQNNSQFNGLIKSKIHSKGKNNALASSRAQSTEQFMKNYQMQKENLRLVQRIGTINSKINLKKFQQQYVQHKRIMKIRSKIKTQDDFFNFKIFDIQFQQKTIDPEQIFFIYQISKQKKKLLLKGKIFQLRKIELKARKSQSHHIKIEGRNWGVVQVKMNNILPIIRNKYEVGNIVIDILNI